MKKKYALPQARIIELQMKENIAESGADATGGWIFDQSNPTGKCYDVVTELKPSKYQGVKNKTELYEAGFDPTMYIVELMFEYPDEYVAIHTQCSRKN